MKFTEENEKQPESPRLKASLFSRLFFWWMNPLMKLGNQRGLLLSDLYNVTPEDKSENLGLALLCEWEKEVARCDESNRENKKKKRASLSKALIRTFGLRCFLLGLVCFLEECILKMVQCLCLGQLLRFLDDKSKNDVPEEYAYLFALGVIFGAAFFVIADHPYTFECYHMGMQIRTACISLLYRKCLLPGQKSMGQANMGHIVNVMSSDLDRFNYAVYYIHYMFVGPVQSLIAATILLLSIGPSCLVGLTIVVLLVPLQSLMGPVFGGLRREMAKRTDERIRKMNELLSGMRVIKMFTWEEHFRKAVEQCRRLEMEIIRRIARFQALFCALKFISPKLIIFLTLIVFVLMDNTLTPDKTFLTLTLFMIVGRVMTIHVPGGIKSVAEARVAIKRVQDLLSPVSELRAAEKPLPNGCAILLENVSTRWPTADMETDGKFSLTDVSLAVPNGQLLAIIGRVGSGKSSLLKLILGELSAIGDKCGLNGRIAYASQESWIFSGTIRQNILCGLEYDDKRYKEVTKAAALRRDFGLFPHGDETVVGERGATLSGGQKARISFARCLYIDADIYLLDDPLSAVDSYVGRHLFDKAIKGFLRDKTRILVTHQIQYLDKVDQILVLEEGRIVAGKSFQELAKTHQDLLNFSVDSEDHASSTTVDHPSEYNGPDEQLPTNSRRSASARERQGLLSEESRSSGRVFMSVYWEYFLAGGGYVSLIFLVLNFLTADCLSTGSDYFLNIWTNAQANRTSSVNNKETEDSRMVMAVDRQLSDIHIYSTLIGGVVIFSTIRAFHLFITGVNSSENLHNRMLHAITQAPIRFFDINPIGRILNRFTKDIGCMDVELLENFYDFVYCTLIVLASVVMLGIIKLWLVLPVAILVFILHRLRSTYIKAALDVKRLEATTRSPVYSHLSTTLLGLATIRAHKCGPTFLQMFHKFQDCHGSAWYMFLATSRWIAIWIDWLCVSYITVVALTCVALRHELTGSEAGLAIASTMSLTALFQWAVRMSVETENKMTSVERVMEYGKIPSEGLLECDEAVKPPPSWPEEGDIQFNGVSLRYSPNDKEPVLKNVSFHIRAKEKIGVVGRTGAGKSSIVASLFRLSEPDGQILINGIDSKIVGLHDLRSKISIIPQDPFLFCGSLRDNLDPTGLYDDDVLWDALEEVKLKDLPSGLDFPVAQDGSNLSVGQKQLVCLARAIVKRNKILVIDEATANVDQKTDERIQISIKNKFKDCTVLTIAHRLNTILDSDRILVMDAGTLKEFDEPAQLLKNPASIFYHLVQQSGIIHETFEQSAVL